MLVQPRIESDCGLRAGSAALWRLPRLALVAVCGSSMFLAAFEVCAARTTFAVIGDYGSDTPEATRVAEMVRGWNPDFVITVGDNTYGDPNINVAEWERRIGQNYGEFILGRTDNRYPSQTSPTQRFFPSVGNHDVIDPVSDGAEPSPGPPYYTGSGAAIRPGYLDYFHTDPGRPGGRLPSGFHQPERSFYEFRWNEAHFFALDSESAFFDSASAQQQATWLQTRALASDAAWKFVFFHHPSYSSGSHGSQDHMQWPFAAWGISAVLTGHDHTYERVSHTGIPYFVNGLGGQAAYPFNNILAESVVRYNENHGAMRVSFDARSVSFEFLAAVPDDAGGFTPTVIDGYELSAAVPEPAAWRQLAISAACALVLAMRTLPRAKPRRR
ncbi:MAG: hypothetical protein DCC68_04620 [Planctomycetota bacterium]|nr:MAG: hypothetical protein DCC68_04620 [Planctomycetota bacterium]